MEMCKIAKCFICFSFKFFLNRRNSPGLACKIEDLLIVLSYFYYTDYKDYKTLQKILAGNQPESGRAVPGSPAGKIKYWSPKFC
jgi:hypothetical protein